MAVTLGTPSTNIPGVDDTTTIDYTLIELPGVDDKALAIYAVNDTTNYKIHARVINTSGTTVDSIGAEQTLHTTSGGSDTITDIGGEADTATRVLIWWVQRPSAYELMAAVATVSGDTVTLGTPRMMRSGLESFDVPDVCWVTSTSIMGLYTESALNDMYVIACTVSGSTISAPGTEVLVDTTTSTTSGNDMAIRGAGDGSRALVCWDDTSNLQTRIAKITTGTTITVHTVNSFLASTTVRGLTLRKVPGDTTTFVLQWIRGINGLPEAAHLTIVTGSDTVTKGTTESWYSADADNAVGQFAFLSPTLALTCWEAGIGTDEGMVSEMEVSGTTLTVDESDDATLAAPPSAHIAKIGATRCLVLYGDVDAVVATTDEITTGSQLWLRNGSGVWSNIGDSSWSDPVRSVAVKPGTNYQTIFAMVGATLYRTDNQGTSWTSKATLTFTPASIELVDGDVVKAYTKDAAGTNRVASINNTTITYFDTGHSTTGAGSTMRGVA